MLKVQYVLFYLTLLSFICHCPCLIELPPVEDNGIMETEVAIRTTINQIFSLLQLKKFRDRQKLKQYGQIHNYFTSVTLRDYYNLKEIAQLTRVDNKNVNNTTLNFIELINAILNADSFAENEENYTNSVEYITEDAANYLESYLKQLNYFEEIVSNGPRVDVNEEVAKILASINIKDLNITETKYNNSEDEDNNILNNYEFWQPFEETRRVYKGKRTRIKTFPFMAVILAFNVFQCAGSIIHSDLVLTAASCLQLAYNNRFYRENPAFLSVRVGSDFHNGGGEVIAILEIFFHPSYNPKTLRNNLAVVRLIRHLKLTKSRVKKIAIDTVEAQLPTNTRGITIVGWGATTASNVIKNGFENRLSFAILDVYYLKDCQDVYSKEYVTQKNFCAGFISKGSGACNRDVGGPGVAAGILRGVVSFGSPQCGTPDAPTVFTKVGFYADWIEGIMEQDVPKGRRQTTPLTRPYFWSTRRTTITERMHVSPVNEVTETLEPLSLGTTTGRPDVRQNKQVDMKLFREFLKTMFNSKEIDEYLDHFMSEKDIGRQLTKSTTEAFPAEFATKNIDFEPEPSDYEAEWTTESSILTSIQESTPHVYKEIEADKETAAEKELEKDIIELINNADLREILLESVSTATMPTAKQQTTNQIKKTKKGNKKGNRKNKQKKIKTQQKSKKSDKKNKMENRNESEKMTFLYLTEEEKDQEVQNLKIYNKANGADDDLEDDLSNFSKEGQDIVLHMTEEEIIDDSVDDNNEEVSNSDDVGNNNENGEIDDDAEPTIGRREEDEQDTEIAVSDGKRDITSNESSQINEVKEGLNIDIPSIPEIPAISGLPEQFIRPIQSQIDFSFRANGVENKDDSQLEPKKIMVDILNEVMIADTNTSETNTLTTDSIPTAGLQFSSQVMGSQYLHTAINNQTKNLISKLNLHLSNHSASGYTN